MTHMCIRYHFIAKFVYHTETRFILFLTKYDRNNYRMNKNTLKNRFFSKRLRVKTKTSVQVSTVPKLTVFL